MTKAAAALAFAALSTAMPDLAFAASTPEAVLADPNRHAVEVAGEFGVTPLQFAICFARVTPAASPAELDGNRERANKATLLPCLQAANPAITNDFLDAVMNTYRAGPPR